MGYTLFMFLKVNIARCLIKIIVQGMEFLTGDGCKRLGIWVRV